MYSILRRLLFALEPERAHHFTMETLKTIYKLPFGETILKTTFLTSDFQPFEWKGLNFRHPVGLAAGFDKDGKYLYPLASLGFSFIEVGTVTPLPQPGNDKPRLFRLPADKALINRMGFNNEGAQSLAARLKQGKPRNLIIGGNIGKNKITPNEEALRDYIACFEALHAQVDYFTINVSSPNTPGLRSLQDKKPLEEIITHLRKHPMQSTTYRPVLLKIAPDLTDEQIDDIAEVCANTSLDGIVATNTTISREGLKTSKNQVESMGSGGLSGLPIQKISDIVLGKIAKKISSDTLLIGVGGIFTAEDVRRKLDLGARLVQVYTGFVYEGPQMVQRIVKNLSKK
ncbi:quinone-dependent dihydroorotate dehydrogenase [Thermaurantimonas aggregans]|nr:quinone-dependent dihydroorotate dehydrogenase [Thermaurantimonas aggregans]MCX8149623.1 quinone-dependent dihydroorotate dehydrogenase [Thermaurantimonas aggregans]